MLNLGRIREEAERDAVLAVLGRVNGNLGKASYLLGSAVPHSTICCIDSASSRLVAIDL